MSTYFPFELSPFQNEAINAIKNGEHCLVTAHTGSGKTVPAEFAIQYFAEKGKRVIYTSPIKALSNQKLFDFRQKYPHISFGIVTGDIEDNKEAQVLIMTTEILANSLLNLKISKDKKAENEENKENQANDNSPLRFTMDYENDLAAVVFDEVHYISDPTRGQAWEQSMMLLPTNVVYVMLSATIANPQLLVNWISDITKKPVKLASTTERVVPLKHYVYTPSLSDKKLRTLTNEQQTIVQKYSDTLTLIKEGEGQTFNQLKYADVFKVHSKYLNNITPQACIPNLIRKLKEKDLLPVLVFVFNRQLTETLAEKLCSSGLPSLFSSEEKSGHDIGGKIEKECRHLLSQKIPNYSDFLECDDFKRILFCLSKGVAYHHAGMMPVLRELVEFLDSKGYVKVLFATETFAVGVNMPTRTVIFSSLTKYSEDGERFLKPHEYTQMAGRAGRRGLDTEGHCILLSPSLSSPNSLASILTGKPNTITSSYKISYHLILGTLEESSLSINELLYRSMKYSHNSLLAPNQKKYIEHLKEELGELILISDKADEKVSFTKTDINDVMTYHDIEKKLSSGMVKGKTAKLLIKQRLKLMQDNTYIERDYEIVKNTWDKRQNVINKEKQIEYANDYACYEINAAIDVLKELNFIEVSDENICTNTKLGKFALSIYEAHPLGLPMFLKKEFNMFDKFKGDYVEQAKLFAKTLSIFTDIKVNDDIYYDNNTKYLLDKVNNIYNHAYYVEQLSCDNGQFHLTQDYKVQGVLVNYIEDWCNAKTNEECIRIIKTVNDNCYVSSGDFVKALLKIVKLSKEIMSACETTNNLVFAAICNEIPKLILKYIVTSQSLYV